MSTTTEPTEAEEKLIRLIASAVDGQPIGYVIQDSLPWLRQHVAAEVAKETERLRAQVAFANSQLKNAQIAWPSPSTPPRWPHTTHALLWS
jgi:hypothetical protein